MRSMIGAAVIVLIAGSVAAAEEFTARIVKVEDGKITVTKFQKGAKKGEKGKEETLKVANNVKVVKAKFNKEEKKIEAGDALEGGLKNERFANLGGEKARGVFAQIVTNDDNVVTEIRVFEGFGGKKGGKKKKIDA